MYVLYYVDVAEIDYDLFRITMYTAWATEKKATVPESLLLCTRVDGTFLDADRVDRH